MHNVFSLTDLETTNSLESIPQKAKECSDILESFGLEYIKADHYLQIGQITRVQGWILHLSIIRTQLINLLEIVIPQLIQAKVAFKIARNKQIAKFLVDGNLGYTQIGKVICIYSQNDEETLELAKQLIQLTHQFKGPTIPTDIHLGGIVYTRYGSFNPILSPDASGKTSRFIYNNIGELVQDIYAIPFVLPKEVNWPFTKIIEPAIPISKKLWNDKYKPISIIKPDAKGRVLKGIYLKKLFIVKPCLIKEGKSNMWVDEEGRDIQDRLKWQHELYNDLKNDIPIPEIFDLFKKNDDLYLVMQFINGSSLENILLSIYERNSWPRLLISKKIGLLNYLLKIIDIIEKLHQKGYIHRDITPTNFLIDKNNRVFMIDLELAYCVSRKKPDPPFKLGTFGFMSREQYERQVPTIKEDIYGLGALMVLFFTGLAPTKFDTKNIIDLRKNLYYFIDSWMLVDTLADCLSNEPHERPTLSIIKNSLENFRKELTTHPLQKDSLSIPEKPSENKLNDLINNAIKGLTNPVLLTSDHLWVSPSVQEDKWIGNEQVELNYNGGIHGGMAGILYTLAIAKRLGYCIDCCADGYYKSWKYIQDNYLDQHSNTKLGLYDGTAGIALAIHEGMNSGLLFYDLRFSEYLNLCFSSTSNAFDMATGIAGQGIALLRCSDQLNTDFSQALLKLWIDKLLTNQRKNGSWGLIQPPVKKYEKQIGLSHGVAGIICFLVAYSFRYPAVNLEIPIKKGMSWLIKELNKAKTNYYWYTSITKSVNSWNSSIGAPGICLSFIKAFELLRDPLYKKIAEELLANLPPRPVHNDFTQVCGLSGLGELYLEAYRVFKTDEWQQRADWIVNIFTHTFLEKEDGLGYWSMTANPDPVASLMLGSCGAIHLLMRYQMPNKLGYPLLSD
ncbi:MAG TPA: lanthionine synthetase LanC family protein [Puia sp.]|nr:lanthionine synthetase LanC family protein [Puia sp.]